MLRKSLNQKKIKQNRKKIQKDQMNPLQMIEKEVKMKKMKKVKAKNKLRVLHKGKEKEILLENLLSIMDP